MITVVLASSNDAYIYSYHASSYSSMLSGTTTAVQTTEVGAAGQGNNGDYWGYQYFVEFPYTATTGLKAVSGFYQMYNVTTYGTNVSRNTNIYLKDFGTTVNTADWSHPNVLDGLPLYGRFYDTQKSSNGTFVYSGVYHVRDALTTTSTMRHLLTTNRYVNQTTPGSNEFNRFRSTRRDGTTEDPQLIVGQHTLNKMTTQLAAQCQLSDGTWVVLDRTSMSDAFVFRVVHLDASATQTVVWTSPEISAAATSDGMRSSQGFALARDDNDNLFVIQPSVDVHDKIYAYAFVKGTGNTWSPPRKTTLQTPYDNAMSSIMQTVAAYHAVGNGRLVVCSVRDWGEWHANSDPYFLLDTSILLHGGSSSAVIKSGHGGFDGFFAKPPFRGYINPINCTGSLLDIHADPVRTHNGYLVTGERSSLMGETGAVSVGRYVIHSNGLEFNSYSFAEMDNNGGWAVYDPDQKLRVIATSQDQFVKLTVDDTLNWGLTMERFSAPHGSRSLSRLGRCKLDLESITSFPTGPNLDMLWDAVYYPVDNKVWIYYVDANDSNRLMRTAVSLDDNLATHEEVVVNATVATTADTLHAIRVQRNRMVADEILVTTSYEDSVGDHHYDYTVDRVNISPTQPLLTPIANYDATNDQTLEWTFSDANVVDSQTAYQLVITDASDASTVLDTGKVASSAESYFIAGGTLANDVDYLWQVRTWDIEDAVSVYSDQSDFSTSSTGVVTVTFPEVDNEELFTTDIELAWSIVGSPQEDYRVVVTRTSDDAVFLDTGWVVSATQSHLVEDILSDVEYLFSVTARNSMVETNTATRLVTTHYATPETPEVLSVSTSTNSEYIEVSVQNPEPRGDRPVPTANRVYRRVADSGTRYTLLGECPLDSVYRDYTVASGVEYEYKVRAVEEG